MRLWALMPGSVTWECGQGMRRQEMSQLLEGQEFDFVFIDGPHTYKAKWL